MNKRPRLTAIGTICFVIGVLALVSLPLPHLMPVTDDAKSKIAMGDIATISLALKMYRLHTGRYPTTEEGLDTLMKPVKEYSNEPYLERYPIDPWSRKYEYRCPGFHSTGGFDLWSQGSDPRKTDDDITNWKTTGT